MTGAATKSSVFAGRSTWGKPSPKRVPLAVVERVLALYREQYFDLNLRHFHEKVREQHAIQAQSQD